MILGLIIIMKLGGNMNNIHNEYGWEIFMPVPTKLLTQYLREEIDEWLTNNCNHTWKYSHVDFPQDEKGIRLVYNFENKDDVTKFKLTWG